MADADVGVVPEHGEAHDGSVAGRLNWLRAGVLGANDGIVSTASLIAGVAAADASHAVILTTGIAGLVAGAMSMAAGEYVSVHSQADTEAADLARERVELLRIAGIGPQPSEEAVACFVRARRQLLLQRLAPEHCQRLGDAAGGPAMIPAAQQCDLRRQLSPPGSAARKRVIGSHQLRHELGEARLMGVVSRRPQPFQRPAARSRQ